MYVLSLLSLTFPLVHCHAELSTRQTSGGLSAAHCPSRGRRGGLCWGSRGWLGMPPCMCRLGTEFGQRSIKGLVIPSCLGDGRDDKHVG